MVAVIAMAPKDSPGHPALVAAGVGRPQIWKAEQLRNTRRPSICKHDQGPLQPSCAFEAESRLSRHEDAAQNISPNHDSMAFDMFRCEMKFDLDET
jgi:hypothetical protein